MNITVFQCDDTVDGIFSAIYDAWASRLGHHNIKIEVLKPNQEFYEQEFFTTYSYVQEDLEKASKVGRAIKQKISESAFEMVLSAAVSKFSWKAESIYRFLILGFAMGEKVVHHLGDFHVQKVFEMNRNVGNEIHFYKGFLRFDELGNQVLIAKYEPQNNITALITPHFADRLSNDNFVIFDVKRRLASLHQIGYPWVMAEIQGELAKTLLDTGQQEDKYKSLWLTFFRNIGVESRKNEALQKNLLRLHYRKHMTEFMSITDDNYFK